MTEHNSAACFIFSSQFAQMVQEHETFMLI